MSTREYHPYLKFIPDNVQILVVGSFPIGKFTHPQRRSEITVNEIDFFYGGSRNNFWSLVGDCYSVQLNSQEKIKSLLNMKKIGIIDVIYSCIRIEGRADDKSLTSIEFNPEIESVIQAESLEKILFTSQQARLWFHQNWHKPEDLTEVVLPSPSGQATRGIGKTQKYKDWKIKNPTLKVYDFCLTEYKKVFDDNVSVVT